MIYKIRIILDAEEDIFRDVEIDANDSLEEFHNVISQAFGFLGNEMASFYTCDDKWNQDEEIALFDMSENGSDVRLMNETFLEDILDKSKPKLIYVYDFVNPLGFSGLEIRLNIQNVCRTVTKPSNELYPLLAPVLYIPK